jgi:mRNA-degrading endonuclease RelE of RelBE toxin-antitoxin system
MSYKVSWKEEAIADMASIPKNVALSIYNKVETFLAKEPRKNGKPLSRELKGLWTAKHSKYRVIYEILENEKTMVKILIMRYFNYSLMSLS